MKLRDLTYEAMSQGIIPRQGEGTGWAMAVGQATCIRITCEGSRTHKYSSTPPASGSDLLNPGESWECVCFKVPQVVHSYQKIPGFCSFEALQKYKCQAWGKGAFLFLWLYLQFKKMLFLIEKIHIVSLRRVIRLGVWLVSLPLRKKSLEQKPSRFSNCLNLWKPKSWKILDSFIEV